MTRPLDNFTFIIFGATGDLTIRKLLPAVYELAKQNKLSNNFRIIGFARGQHTHQSFRKELNDRFKENSSHLITDDDHFHQFCKNLYYVQSDYNDKEGYIRLKKEIETATNREGICDNLLFYLATPPAIAKPIIHNLHKIELSGISPGCTGWHKIIIEKPFGSDLATAKDLNTIIYEGFREHQIYRMDHYLAKETVQNILVFRFANGLFEQIWNHHFIDHVQITVSENFGIRNRGAYYEKSGLIRDIIQNHALQLLALVAMEAPVSDHAEAIRDEKTKVITSLIKAKKAQKSSSVILGQYNGYLNERQVAKNSNVETFAAIKLYSSMNRWKGVPFYIRAGKQLKDTKTEIFIKFKPTHTNLFKKAKSQLESNELSIKIQPEESISLTVGAKRPGPDIILDPVHMMFDYKSSFREDNLEAYHRLLMDAIVGDQTRFIRNDGIEAQWDIIDYIKAKSSTQTSFPYDTQSWGPIEADNFIKQDGRRWHE
jgi:glucose-6-phosphate 1-dehydrogenase